MKTYSKTLLILAALSVHGLAFAQTEMHDVRASDTRIASESSQEVAHLGFAITPSSEDDQAQAEDPESNNARVRTEYLRMAIKGRF